MNGHCRLPNKEICQKYPECWLDCSEAAFTWDKAAAWKVSSRQNATLCLTKHRVDPGGKKRKKVQFEEIAATCGDDEGELMLACRTCCDGRGCLLLACRTSSPPRQADTASRSCAAVRSD